MLEVALNTITLAIANMLVLNTIESLFLSNLEKKNEITKYNDVLLRVINLFHLNVLMFCIQKNIWAQFAV